LGTPAIPDPIALAVNPALIIDILLLVERFAPGVRLRDLAESNPTPP
jgi:hypothetical protein